MKESKVTIIGLGLIGGSLAKALHERAGFNNISAVNHRRAALEQALEEGVIRKAYDNVCPEALDADIVFICTPVKYTLEYLPLISGGVRPGCIVTDVGSTKGDIIKLVNGMPNPPCFVGGHPMAGSEKSGYSASRAHLFENAYYILTPSGSSTEAAMDRMKELARAVGGIPVVLGPDEHDRITGSISHLPHILASSLVNLVKSMETPDGKMQLLAAGGFKDITRIASSSPEMWESIVSSNSVQISRILDAYTGMLEDFRRLMLDGDSAAIHSFFESARTYRNSFASNGNKGLIDPIYDIIVDVVDRPGIIGEVATVLGEHGINIKNINVTNSREFEQGCLRITLPDAESVAKAYDCLNAAGYKAYKTR